MIQKFEDLEFNPHPNGLGGVQAKHKLENGVILSVVGGKFLYGDGVDTFEVGAWIDGSDDWIKLGDNDNVTGWRTKEEVTDIIQQLLKIK